MNYICLDELGNPITFFTQWDINRSVTIKTADFGKPPLVHFCNIRSKEALVVQSELLSENGSIVGFKVKVPNIVLQAPFPLHMFIFARDFDFSDEDISNISINDLSSYSSKSLKKIVIDVVNKPKPSEYEYVENIKPLTFDDLDKRLQGQMTNVLKSISETDTELRTFVSNTDSELRSYVSGVDTDLRKKVDDTDESLRDYVSSTDEARQKSIDVLSESVSDTMTNFENVTVPQLKEEINNDVATKFDESDSTSLASKLIASVKKSTDDINSEFEKTVNTKLETITELHDNVQTTKSSIDSINSDIQTTKGQIEQKFLDIQSLKGKIDGIAEGATKVIVDNTASDVKKNNANAVSGNAIWNYLDDFFDADHVFSSDSNGDTERSVIIGINGFSGYDFEYNSSGEQSGVTFYDLDSNGYSFVEQKGSTSKGVYVTKENVLFKENDKTVFDLRNHTHASVANASALSGFGLSAPNSRFGVIPTVGTDGVMEVGKYIDFHIESNDGENDNAARITCDEDGRLNFSSPLPIGSGGTGASNSNAALENLRLRKHIGVSANASVTMNVANGSSGLICVSYTGNQGQLGLWYFASANASGVPTVQLAQIVAPTASSITPSASGLNITLTSKSGVDRAVEVLLFYGAINSIS